MFNIDHFNWGEDNGFRVYACPIANTMYSGKGKRNGRSVKVNMPYVEIIVEIGGRKKSLSELPLIKPLLTHTEDSYEQGELLTKDIHTVYKYYYERSHKTNK
tara:strand:+ start:198 stop:503 length:306 start_codon:yes stop_codon:yes gene_type:complete